MNRYFLFVGALLLSTALHAKIWRLNNNVGIDADFTTLQAAHDADAVQPGDTLHLEGSPTNYGGLSTTKKLVITGPGYYLDQNPKTQANALSAQVQAINIYKEAAGTVVQGLSFATSTISVFANDVTIRRNNFASPGAGQPESLTGQIYLYYQQNQNGSGVEPLANVLITQNYAVWIASQSRSYPAMGVLITNNYLTGGIARGGSNSTALNLDENDQAIVQNNVILGRVMIYNSNLQNNIMAAGTLTGTANLTSNNLANESQFGTANGNKANVNMDNVFVGAGTGVSTDGRWQLKVGSPAVGAGFNGVDAGMYGNTTPYRLSGMPSMPSIYFFENQSVGSSSDPIDVTIRVKSNP